MTARPAWFLPPTAQPSARRRQVGTRRARPLTRTDPIAWRKACFASFARAHGLDAEAAHGLFQRWQSSGATTRSETRDGGSVSAIHGGYRSASAQGGAAGLATMVGEFAVFNQWTEIDSAYEGRFLERVAPSAFTKTFAENRDGMRALFSHGRDPQIGQKPLGPITDLRSTATGAAYAVELLDTSYNRDLIPGLDAGQYGASFAFQATREDLVASPGASAWNPHGLPERTILEAKVREFGPTPFGAYPSASAGLRSAPEATLRKLVARGLLARPSTPVEQDISPEGRRRSLHAIGAWAA